MKLFPFSLIILFIVIFSYGCGSDSEKFDQTVKVYVEKTIAEERFMNEPDSLKKNVDQVFSKYGITREEYDKTLKSFEYNKEKWLAFLDSADAYLGELRKTKNTSK